MSFERASGILLHPTSLPGGFGIGDLGPAAFDMVEALAHAGQRYWQILPLGPTGWGDSPYQSFSAFAGNTLLISPGLLVEDGIIDASFLAKAPEFDGGRVNYGAVYDWKTSLLDAAADGLEKLPSGDIKSEAETFFRLQGSWLEDYAAYRAIKASQGQRPWNEWPDALKFRDRDAVRAKAEELGRAVRVEKYAQFLFHRQWKALRRRANELGIKIIGDMPIFVALDSADVWCNQSKFKLEPDGSPSVVSGVPPDYFSASGQLWGNPIYDWDEMRASGFEWWIARVRSLLERADIARIDHFRGFAACWEVPGKDKTAENGAWVEAPGHEIFAALKRSIGELPFIAEDLGVITPEVTELRDEFGFPGMRILEYAFGGDPHNEALPHNYIRNCVAYTGTHDNDTAIGWFESKAGKGSTRDAETIDREHEFCLKYLASDGKEINWDMIRALWSSIANSVIVPLQDVLGVGTEGRMNLPGSAGGRNWQWRYQKGDFTPELIDRLAEITEIYGRRVS